VRAASNERCLVVGGGLTGCVSALLLAERGATVTLCESAAQLGGVLRDHVNAGERYFASCQYLSVAEPWFQRLPAAVRRLCVEFEHTYGSVTEFREHAVATRDMAMPVFPPEAFALDELAPTLDNGTLHSRLAFYPASVGQSLRDWAARHGIDPGAVCGENAIALQMSRVHPAGQDHAVAAFKRHPASDAMLALPLKRRLPGRSVRAALPANGFDAFFDTLEQSMILEGIRIRKGTPVKLHGRGAGIDFLSRSERLGEVDTVVWASNPNPLLKGLGLQSLGNVHARSQTHLYDLGSAGTSWGTEYYQVFSDRTDVNRLFTYTLGGRARMTVECLADGRDPRRISDDAGRLLRQFGHPDLIHWRCQRRDKRYIFHSDSDRAVLSGLADGRLADNCRIIDAGWLEYGRDAKINRIADQLGGF